MGGYYAPPKLFSIDTNDTATQDTQPFRKASKGKGVDRPVNTDFAGDLHSRVSTPSITIDEFEMDDHDYEHMSDVEDYPPHNDAVDLVQSIKGMYRVLDLISEQGSGGLVDKTIIAQDSLRAFTNTICPGAYVSMTKVNFSALDGLFVKPVGIYGSKEEIVRLLLSLGVVDDHVAAQLVADHSDSKFSTPSLRSGLYVVRTNCEATSDEQLFVVYWPEDGTWDDAAPSSMKRNRITFMRLPALISPEHSRSIVWSEREGEDDDSLMEMEDEQDESDRMATFEVRKSNEQEEAVHLRPGFQATSDYIAMPQPDPDATVNVSPHKPWLLYGETTQGFMTISNVPARETAVASKRHSITHLRLGAGLGNRFPQLYKQWQQESVNISSNARDTKASTEAKIKMTLEKESPLLARIIHRALVDAIIRVFPMFTHDSFPDPTKSKQGNPIAQGLVEPVIALSELTDDTASHSMEGEQDSSEIQDQLQTVIERYPEIGEAIRRTVQKLHIEVIDSRDFKTCKERVCIAQSLFRQLPDVQTKDEDFLNVILHEDMKRVKESLGFLAQGATPHGQSKGMFNKALSGFNSLISSGPRSQSVVDQMLKDAEASASTLSDAQFLVQLDDVEKLPVMKKIVAETRAVALTHFKSLLMKQTTTLTHNGLRVQIDTCLARARWEATSSEEQQLAESRRRFIIAINAQSQASQNSRTFLIDAVENGRVSSEVQITGSRRSFEHPKLKFTVHLMQLTTQDLHSLQFDSSTIPSPKFRNSYSFKLPIRKAQLLPSEKILLATTDRVGNLTVYLEHLTAIDNALAHGGRGKRLNRDKIGEFVLAFDESKHMLGVVATEKASGSAINLTQWYTEGTSISHACFICGSEELLLVDTFAQARVYSLTTMQFRPATLDLIQIPKAVYSTPDGSCLIAAHVHGSNLKLTAYHWSTFGSTDGISLEIPDLPLDQPLLLTSLTSRNIVHLVTLDIDTQSCRSVALDITRKVTEFTFKEKGARGGHTMSENVSDTANNCLIDCHAQVWTRFPVLPAVQRATITSFSSRCPRTLAFITDRDHHLFVPHFHDLISHFERTSKKPTGNILKSMMVSATTFSAFSDSLLSGAEWSVSKFRAGEWLAEFLCLIPIQIAVTKENRFIPLKDGVYSTELEKSLLGADVNRIVDYVSFGWYESLFQSYMAKKPVKLVSSMGEQSVGKSFSLNHLVDTSFAGSAMRTTEGVWMSVLFRNNFALNRDITGLFQSFQSSSTVLDPAANPSLFQSALVIIIKDVVDSDKAEIIKEYMIDHMSDCTLKLSLRFALKFQRIVRDEQESNFISRLHAGQLNIVPWPVIESREFYKLFPTLKRRLDKQKLTHNTAGEFLHAMKTLMAKLKPINSNYHRQMTGELSHRIPESMASHRAQFLLAVLPNALSFGLQEVNPDPEPLKNLDNDIPIDMPDTSSEFSLVTGGVQQSSTREAALQVLCHAWGDYNSRQYVSEDVWIENLTTHIDNLVGLRIAHVGEWISSNVARFQSGQASIDELMRTFDSATVDLKTNVQLCKLKCASCELFCVQSRLHDGQHTCRTSHVCIHSCDFCVSSGETKACSMLCVVNAHLCGQICGLFGKQGCLDECTKVIGHTEGDHLCAATVHACGQPCDLSKLMLADGSTPCRDTCGIAIVMPDFVLSLVNFAKDYVRTQTIFTACKTALFTSAEEHLCSKACTADGICEIETTPQSIEATFTGRHETFQYTKYFQVAKRLRCVKTVPPGAVVHKGPHNHSLDKNVVHFCRERCEHCGYYCTLPLGHPQQEHETRHGSMSSSRWVVDGPDDTGLEVEGRRFSSNDEGTPMMCNLVCQAVGRHVHVDYCRASDTFACRGNTEVQHISKRLMPNPERAKDYVTHNLFWRRAGFKDPYSREEQAEFTKCDSMCSGPEHTAAAGNTAQPSYCTLPLFHPPVDPHGVQVGLGNPVVMQQAFHVRPLPNTPASDRITQRSDNRFGAVLSSLYYFWSARAAAIGAQQGARRDSYSVILFNTSTTNAILMEAPASLLRFSKLDQSWNNTGAQKGAPVIIFLSDGEDYIADQPVQDLCRSAVRLGMSQIALDIQNNAPRDPLVPPAATVASSYTQALDTVQLAETFLGIAESLRKPRGSLIH
ncbi:hypothetical protein EDD22DRAFT_843764 [Suillus occidentalis]|nr:hypothetical protein EDD22DRAFT_843764 [Suillus occidentalis]